MSSAVLAASAVPAFPFFGPLTGSGCSTGLTRAVDPSGSATSSRIGVVAVGRRVEAADTVPASCCFPPGRFGAVGVS